jgi:predicted transcriptional regulator
MPRDLMTVRIERALRRRLDEAAKGRHLTPSAAARLALESWVEAEERSTTLVEAGALAALVDASDPRHAACAAALRQVRGRMATVWPAVAEAVERLREVPEGQRAVLEMLRRGAVRLLPLGQEDVARLQELVAGGGRRPIGLAAAALVRVAERDGLDEVFAVERKSFERHAVRRRRLRIRIIPVGRRGVRRRRRGGGAARGGR